jgi:hypothetical protein
LEVKRFAVPEEQNVYPRITPIDANFSLTQRRGGAKAQRLDTNYFELPIADLKPQSPDRIGQQTRMFNREVREIRKKRLLTADPPETVRLRTAR